MDEQERAEGQSVLGVDSPETVAPGKPVGCGGPQATAFAKQLLTGQQVTLVADPTLWGAKGRPAAVTWPFACGLERS